MPRPAKKAKPRTLKVWVGIYKPDDEVCTWSAATVRRVCRIYLRDVYSEEETRSDLRMARATLTLDPPPPKPRKRP